MRLDHQCVASVVSHRASNVSLPFRNIVIADHAGDSCMPQAEDLIAGLRQLYKNLIFCSHDTLIIQRHVEFCTDYEFLFNGVSTGNVMD